MALPYVEAPLRLGVGAAADAGHMGSRAQMAALDDVADRVGAAGDDVGPVVHGARLVDGDRVQAVQLPHLGGETLPVGPGRAVDLDALQRTYGAERLDMAAGHPAGAEHPEDRRVRAGAEAGADRRVGPDAQVLEQSVVEHGHRLTGPRVQQQDQTAELPGPYAVFLLGAGAGPLDLGQYVGLHPDGDIAGVRRAALHRSPLVSAPVVDRQPKVVARAAAARLWSTRRRRRQVVEAAVQVWRSVIRPKCDQGGVTDGCCRDERCSHPEVHQVHSRGLRLISLHLRARVRVPGPPP